MKNLLVLIMLVCLHQALLASLDVVHYRTKIEPNLKTGEVTGEVTIRFVLPEISDSITLSSGKLEVFSCTSGQKKIPHRRNGQLRILAIRDLIHQNNQAEVTFNYIQLDGKFLNFNLEADQIFSAYSTQQWMVCNPDLLDKAMLDLTIIAPQDYSIWGSGNLVSSYTEAGNRKGHHFQIKAEVPAYCFGFAVGNFQQVDVHTNKVTLKYLGNHDTLELKKIFHHTAQMIRFMEEKSGLPYALKTYTQIIAKGGVSQEMEGYAVLWEGYGKQVLEDSSKINLSAHEIAHQWWGNKVSCVDWRHFWLNEGLAVFMSSAYVEYAFGRQKYEEDIAFYRRKYQAVPDKPLQFPNWDNPSKEDRTLVYFKGACFFHELRTVLGEKDFWTGIREYTSRYAGAYADSRKLQQVFEDVSGKSLEVLFAEWVYPRP